jgi:hypothetical protein
MKRDCIKTDLTAIYCEDLACIEVVQMQMIVKTVLLLLVIQRAATFLAVKREPVSPRKFV